MEIEITKRLARNSLRLKDYDYSQPGVYFVTICTENRDFYLGNIVDGIMISFPISEIVRKIWLEIPETFQCVDLDAFIIMPNHVHGIIIIHKECRDLIHQTRRNNSKSICRGFINQTHIKDCKNDSKVDLINKTPTKMKNWILMQNSKRTIGRIVRYFKAKSTKIIHDGCFSSYQWQRNYYEHVVRSSRELNSIREYIINNPIKWALDRENRLSKNFNMDLDRYFKDIFKE